MRSKVEINYHKEKGVKNCLYSLPVTIITVEKFFQSGPVPQLELNRVFHGNKYQHCCQYGGENPDD